jgi:hypothetical protein
VTLTIGVDVGGTKVLAGVVDPAGKVLAETRRHTPAHDVSGTLSTIIEVIRELAVGREIEAVGIGAAGWIDERRSTVLFAPNLAWKDEPLRDKVAAEVGVPVDGPNTASAPLRQLTAAFCSPWGPASAARWCWAGCWYGVRTGSLPSSGTSWPYRVVICAAVAGGGVWSSMPAAGRWYAKPAGSPPRIRASPVTCWPAPTATHSVSMDRS